MVASIQASARRLASGLPDADVVVFDEAHHMKARTWSELSRHYGAAKVLGLTATPYRYDGQPLTDCFDVIVTGPTYEQLFEMGHLAEPDIYSWKSLDLRDAKTSGGDYAKGEGDRIRQLIGCPVEHWKKHGRNHPSAYFAVNVEHAEQVTERFNAAGVPAVLLTSETPTSERDKISADLRSERVKIVVNVEVLTEGWDMPELRCLIIGRPTRSLVLHRQMCGRVMRAGEKPVILDHCGNALLLGKPWKEIAPSLTEALPSPGKHGSAESRSRTCPECGNEVPMAAPKCACGHVFWSVVPDEDASRHLELLNGPSVRERAVEMVRGGMTQKAAAGALGVSISSVHYWCKGAGISRSWEARRALSPEQQHAFGLAEQRRRLRQERAQERLDRRDERRRLMANQMAVDERILTQAQQTREWKLANRSRVLEKERERDKRRQARRKAGKISSLTADSMGDAVKKLRWSMGLNQSEFGLVLGVAKYTIQTWEKNKARPRGRSSQRLASIAAALGGGDHTSQDATTREGS